MAQCAPNFAYANEEEAFAVLETSCGSLKKPANADQLFTVGPVDFTQDQEFLDDEQIRSTASRTSQIKGRKMIGDFSFDSYVKPSGALGTAPEHDILFESLLGTGTPNAGVSYVYTLENQLESFSFWVKKGHTVYAFRGAVSETADFTIAGNAIAGIGWGCKYMEQLWAGTILANDTCNIGKTQIQLPSKGAQLYRTGMYVHVGTDTRSGNGYILTDVNYTNDTITINPALLTNQGLNPEISPWWPASPGGDIGEPVHGKLGLVKVGGADAIVLNATVSIANNVKYYEDEKNNVWTAERFGRPKVREIEGNLNLYFLKRGPSYFYRAEYQVSDALIIPAGNVAGYIMEISVPYAEYRTPKVSGDEEFIQDVPFIAVASAAGGNDELEITFK